MRQQRKTDQRRQTKRIYQRTKRKQKKQHGSFLNCYGFAYAGRDVVNQAAKVALE